MATGILGIISGAIGIVALLLKYYPDWRRKRETERAKDEQRQFEQALFDSDPRAVSELLRERMRGGKENGGDA